jgi:hypothetical protein
MNKKLGNHQINYSAILDVLSRCWVFGLVTNNPILIDLFTAESVIIGMMNDKIFKVRSLMGHFCDISEIFFGGMRFTSRKLKCKNSEGNKGGEHVFNPIVTCRCILCHDAQYPIINIREIDIPSNLLKNGDNTGMTT